MRKQLTLLVLTLLALSLVPTVLAVTISDGIGINIETEEFTPKIWMCDSRSVIEDCVEEGRDSDCTDGLYERLQNYAFEGEQIKWTVLVMDKNKIEQVTEVAATIGTTQGQGNDIEVECQEVWKGRQILDSCEARILEEKIVEFEEEIMAYYDCLFTVETPESMQGENFLTVEACDATDLCATMAENEFWYLNPVIALSIDGDVDFAEVRPGTVSYSSTILVGNDADPDTGVMMDMFISGTDFYDPDVSGARCPDTNQLQLSNSLRSPATIQADGGRGIGFSPNHVQLACEAGTAGLTASTNSDHLCYFATSGSYSTAAAPNADAEGYVPIVYGDVFTRDFYNDAEIIHEAGAGTLDLTGACGPALGGSTCYHKGNVLSPGSEIALTFKLGLPEPCVGNFNEGDIFFWGEAI